MRIGEAIIRDATKVTKAWTAYQKRRIRSWGRATWRPPRRKKDTIKDLAWRVMPEAYAKAAGRVGMAAPRQVFYAARPAILAGLDDEKELKSVYFTQVLLPDYMAAHPSETAGWDVVWDDRGHFYEPHTGKEFGLGTLAVRNYLNDCGAEPDTELTVDALKTDYPTLGPTNRYRHVLLIEKEGFQQIFEHVGLDTRFDLAIMSSKGMNTTSARALVERLPGVRFFVLHDFDQAGFSILGTLTRSTRRYHFRRLADIVDLGIRLEDVRAEDLASEPVSYRGDDPARNLSENGATKDEIEFLVGGQQRVEINAFDNDHLIAWLERKLTAHGVKKLIPDDATLVNAYRRAILIHTINDGIEDAQQAASERAKRARVPASLGHQVRRRLTADPTLAWDDAIAEIAAEMIDDKADGEAGP